MKKKVTKTAKKPTSKKKWLAYGVVTGTKYLGEFYADTEEEATEMAWKEAHVSVCHQCSEEVSDPQIEDLNVELAEDE